MSSFSLFPTQTEDTYIIPEKVYNYEVKTEPSSSSSDDSSSVASDDSSSIATEDSSSVASEDSSIIEVLNQNEKSTNFTKAFNTMDTSHIEPITINSEESSSVELPSKNVANSSVKIFNFTEAFEDSLSRVSNHNDIFKCQFCDYSSIVRDFLLEHLKTCHKRVKKQGAINSYQCRLCVYNTSVSGFLLIHLEKFHNLVCSYSSAVKKKFLSHPRRKKHQLFNKKDPEPVRSSFCVCSFCDYKTESYYHLRKHILDLHSPLELFECNQCDYIGAKKGYLTLHNKIHATAKSGANCGFCNFSTKGNLKYHYSMCHSSVILGRPENLVKSQELTEDNNPVCYVCQYRAESYYHIRTHLKLHASIEPTECDKCDYVTGPIEKLFDHYYLMHQNNEFLGFKCSYCNFPTNSGDSLEHHNEMYHKSLRADELEQNIRSLRPLITRNLTINNACSKCGVVFKDRFDFKRHCTEGHVVADQNLAMKREKYRCQFCVFHSKYEKEFRWHLYRHRDERLKCDNCRIIFSQVTDLDQHILVFHQHCNLCEVGFRTSWDQLKHQTIHNRKCRVWLKRLPPKLTVPRVRVCLAEK